MTNRGPFGLPRLTDIPPFSSDNVVVELDEDRVSDPLLPIELDGLLSSINVNPQNTVKVQRIVRIKQKPDEGPSGILNELKKDIADLGERAASIRYYIVDNEIGYIHRTDVDRRFRRKGVASTLRQSAIDDMKSLGVREIYTKPINKAGEGLARSQGFTDSDVKGMLSLEVNNE